MSSFDLSSFAAWWLVQLVLGLVALPLLLPFFSSRSGAAYAAAKVVGAAFATYCAVLLARLGVAPFAGIGTAAGIAVLLALSALALCMKRGGAARFIANLRGVIFIEAVSAAFLLGAVILRAGKPGLIGVEKFMNLAFLNASYFADGMPPGDPWFAGESINYYFFGHTIAALMSQAAAVPPAVGYNLMMAQVVAWLAGASTAFVHGVLSDRRGMPPRVAIVASLCAPLVLLVGGNGHAFIYGALRPLLYIYGLAGPPAKSYFFPDSTRFIGFDPPTDDHAFTEFPSYSFAIGDLHAHYLDLPLGLALVLVLWLGRRDQPQGSLWPLPWRVAALCGLIFGFVIMTNTWDFLSYGLLLAVAGALALAFDGPLTIARLFAYGAQGLAVAFLAIIVALPHLTAFTAFAEGVTWAEGRTPLWQFAVIFGNLAIPAACVTVVAFRYVASERRMPSWAIAIAALSLTALLLLVIPEILRVKDMYGYDHRRANTVFKLSYAAFVMLALPATVAVGFAATIRRTWLSAVTLVALGLLLLPPLIYPLIVWDQNLRPGPEPLTLDGLVFLQTDGPDDVAIRRYLLDHRPPPGSAILEASGESYTYAGRLSATTGIPTVLGWEVHEWLWRGPESNWAERADAIRRFYTIADTAERCTFISKHDIAFIVVGAFERQRYLDIDVDGLKRLGTVAFRQRDSLIIDVRGSARHVCGELG